MILTKKISTLANFQLFSSHLVCIDGPIDPLKPVQTRTIHKGALRFATQISALLNLLKDGLG